MSIYTIVGYQKTSFVPKDNPKTRIEGMNLFLTSELDSSKEGTKGLRAEKLFLTTAKLNDLSFSIEIGDRIQILYNRFGKPQTILKQEDIDFD